MLEAHRGDLGIEREVACGVTIANRLPEHGPVSLARDEEARAGTRKEPVERSQCVIHIARVLEEIAMRHDPEELPQDEHRETPRLVSNREIPES